MQSKNKVLSPNKQSVLSSNRHGSLSLVAGGQEGAELWLTTYCVEVDLRYVELQQVIVYPSSDMSAAPRCSINCSGLCLSRLPASALSTSPCFLDPVLLSSQPDPSLSDP